MGFLVGPAGRYRGLATSFPGAKEGARVPVARGGSGWLKRCSLQPGRRASWLDPGSGGNRGRALTKARAGSAGLPPPTAQPQRLARTPGSEG